MSWISSLVDTSGFVPRKQCGDWTPEWIALHTMSDLFIWLAYLSIPLVLLAASRHLNVRSFRSILLLFALFIVTCGSTHLVEALLFEVPIYRLSGVLKLLTAIVSWITVLTLVRLAPRLIAHFDSLPSSNFVRDEREVVYSSTYMYFLAVLSAVLVVTLRYALHPLLGDLHAFSAPIMAVIFVAWYGGFGPGLVTMLLSGLLTILLILPNPFTNDTTGLSHQFGVGFYIFIAVGVIILGELQRTTRRRLHRKMRQLSSTAKALSVEKQISIESLATLDSLIHNAPYGIAYFDEELRYIRVNNVFANDNGMPVDFHIGKRVQDVHSDFSADLYSDYKKVLDTGVPMKDRIVMGPQVVWELTVFPVPMGANKQGLGVIGVDVTDRYRTAERLRESESRFRLLTESMPQIVWTAGADGSHEYYNSRWYEFTGLSSEGSIAWGWTDQLHADDIGIATDRWADAVSHGTVYDVEYRLRRANGEYHWFLARAVPARDDTGKVIRWLGTCTHIEDQKRQSEMLEQKVAERTAELRQQRIFLDAILDNVSEGIVACGADGRLRLFNAAARRMHQLPVESLSSDSWAETYDLYEVDGATPMTPDRIPLARAWRGEYVIDAEMLIRAPNQPERYVVCSGQQLLALDGTRFGAVISMRDMTDRRAHERQLVQTAAALRASNEELETFAYIASHDLQEPLRKIQAFGTRLASRHRALLGEEGLDYIDRMLDSAGRMRQLIDDLLSFSRVSTKASKVKPVDLNIVARDVLSDLEERLLVSGGRVDVGHLPTLPGDEGQLRQVFQNLIGNALKFTRPGVPSEVRVCAKPLEDLAADADPPRSATAGWRIVIADNGIGFETGYAERIFELFQRLHPRTAYEGTGLGLAIVRKILLRHGALIIARGKPGAGASFIIDWPTTPALHT